MMFINNVVYFLTAVIEQPNCVSVCRLHVFPVVYSV